MRCLKQLALYKKYKFPLVAKAILFDSYMDDKVSRSFGYELAIELKTQVINIFSSHGKTFHK